MAISKKSAASASFFILIVLGLSGYWLSDNFRTGGNFSNPENMPAPTLPPPQLTESEKSVIFESVRPPAGNGSSLIP